MPAAPRTLHIIASFHYDVAYLKTFEEYLPICFRNLDEALRILEAEPEWRFVVEQVILLQEYWERCPEKREAIRRFIQEGRLNLAPGMYVMPDMNHLSGESLFLQARLGKQWLAEEFGVEPTVCWIADCWGHPAQLPQILTQCGYETYVFWRCMRRDVLRNDFWWEGPDGTRIRAHWLARGYGNLRFPTQEQVINAPDLSLTGCGPQQIAALVEQLDQYGAGAHVLLCNGGDFMFPQDTGPEVVRRLNAGGELPPLRFSTPQECLQQVDWESVPVVTGDFNSALQGTFTSNVRIKQQVRALTYRVLALEVLAAVLGSDDRLEDLWRPVLKQQFHDIICGTLTDGALEDAYRELGDAQEACETRLRILCGGEAAVPAAFNPLCFARKEVLEHRGHRLLVSAPAVGAADLTQAEPLLPLAVPALPVEWEGHGYRARIGTDGYVTSLEFGGRELAASQPAPFGSLGLQMDYGDLWLNFEAPLNGGSLESSLTQNAPDPYDRSVPDEIVNRGTMRPRIAEARVLWRNAEELCVEQEGQVGFWQLSVRFRTRVILRRSSPRIDFETTVMPAGKHYRLRVAFATTLEGGQFRHEIGFGTQEREVGEHVAQNWADLQDERGGLGLLNAGTPGVGADGGVLMLTLMRSVAMEYKAPSEQSFGEGVEHVFRYAIVPHGPEADGELVRHGLAFNSPLLACALPRHRLAASGWSVSPANVVASALRPHPEGVFVRLYEATGRATEAVLKVPGGFSEWSKADGLERASGGFAACNGAIRLALRGYEICGVVLRRGR
jgi:alpha-mannosidase